MSLIRDMADAVLLTLCDLDWQDYAGLLLFGVLLTACVGVTRRVG